MRKLLAHKLYHGPAVGGACAITGLSNGGEFIYQTSSLNTQSNSNSTTTSATTTSASSSSSSSSSSSTANASRLAVLDYRSNQGTFAPLVTASTPSLSLPNTAAWDAKLGAATKSSASSILEAETKVTELGNEGAVVPMEQTDRARNWASLGALLLGFFEFYAKAFVPEIMAISVRQGHLIWAEDKKHNRPASGEKGRRARMKEKKSVDLPAFFIKLGDHLIPVGGPQSTYDLSGLSGNSNAVDEEGDEEDEDEKEDGKEEEDDDEDDHDNVNQSTEGVTDSNSNRKQVIGYDSQCGIYARMGTALIIEDPFDPRDNVARSLVPSRADAVFCEITRAFQVSYIHS